MFFLTTVVSQLVYTLGGSGFAGANGSMMIEVVVGSSSIALHFDLLEPDQPVFACFLNSLSSILWRRASRTRSEKINLWRSSPLRLLRIRSVLSLQVNLLSLFYHIRTDFG